MYLIASCRLRNALAPPQIAEVVTRYRFLAVGIDTFLPGSDLSVRHALAAFLNDRAGQPVDLLRSGRTLNGEFVNRH